MWLIYTCVVSLPDGISDMWSYHSTAERKSIIQNDGIQSDILKKVDFSRMKNVKSSHLDSLSSWDFCWPAFVPLDIFYWSVLISPFYMQLD